MTMPKAIPGARSPEDLRLAMSLMMAMAGHDLKQPLQVAAMSMARASREGVDRHTAGCLAIAMDALARLDRELDDIARSSQADDGLFPKYVAVRLDAIIGQAEKDWCFYAEACGVDLRFEPTKAFVRTDRVMLGTILRNLVGNAIKYSGPCGHVAVVCRPCGDAVSVEVHDDGCGIAQSRLSGIFEAFERGDRPVMAEGLGLGLHIVRRTAELLRHEITVASVEGRGTVFSVSVPRC